MSNHYQFKLIVVGDSGTGKSCLVDRFTSQGYIFNTKHETTIGVDFAIKLTTIKLNNVDYQIKSQLWDTAGQEVFRSITSSYYKNAAGILLVFDLSVRRTFDKLDYWLNQINIHATPNTSIFLLGNKNDILEREVTIEEVTAFAEKNAIFYLETSAKECLEGCDTFYQINKQILKKVILTNDIPGVSEGIYTTHYALDKRNDCCTIL